MKSKIYQQVIYGIDNVELEMLDIDVLPQLCCFTETFLS